MAVFNLASMFWHAVMDSGKTVDRSMSVLPGLVKVVMVVSTTTAVGRYHSMYVKTSATKTSETLAA